MCILFLKTNLNPKDDEYALILVNNRDEDFRRPTLMSDVWEEDPNVIGGRDNTPGKEGGTWMGMSIKGKIGILLNVLQPVGEENAQAKGRGGLVADFLTGNVNGEDYLNSIYQEKDLYNNFNLVTIEVKRPFTNFAIGHYSNLTDEPPERLSDGVHGIGNCHHLTPWNKISYGKEKFEKICDEYPNIKNRSELVQQLTKFLSDETKHCPDPQLWKQGVGKSDSTLESLSALFVKIPEINYGTRTHTIVLVHGDGMVEYIEQTMIEPIDAYNPKFLTNKHSFNLP